MAAAARALPLAGLALGCLAGCHGSSVEAPADAADATPDGSEAGCSTVPGNAVHNASFENAPGGVLAGGWSLAADVTFEQKKGDAAHCEAWASVTLPKASRSVPTYLGQDMLFDPAPAAGSTVTATMWVRTLDADTSGLFRVGVMSGSYDAKPISLAEGGAWKLFTTSWPLPTGEDLHTLSVGFISESGAPRTIGLDHVTFVVTPP